MKLIKKTLSFCLILSIICTSLVFTGVGTVYAADPVRNEPYYTIQYIDPVTGEMSEVDPETGIKLAEGEALYIDFTVPASTIAQGDKTAGIYFCKPGSTNNDFYTFMLSKSSHSMNLEGNNWKAIQITGTLPQKDCHVTIKHHYYGDTFGITYVYANGVLIKEFDSEEADSNYVHPTFNNAIGMLKNRDQLLYDISVVASADDLMPSYTANFTVKEGVTDVVIGGKDCDDAAKSVDTPIFYDYTLTCPEGISLSSLVQDKLSYTGTLSLKRGTQTITDIESAGELMDNDILILTSSKGTLINEYKVIISRPVLFTLPATAEYDDFNEIAVTLSDDVGAVTGEDVQLFFNGIEDTLAECTVNGKSLTITGFKPPVGEVNVQIKVTDENGTEFISPEKSITVTLAEPLTLNASSSMDYSKLKSISAKLSSYFDANAIEAAKLYFDNTEQTEASWSIDGGVITFTNLAPSLGAVNIKAEIIYDGNSYSDTAAVNIAEYKLSDTAASKGWYYYSYAGKVMEGAIKTEEQGGDAKFTYTFGSSWSNFKNKQETQATIHPRLLIGNSEATAPAADERVYKVVFPFKLKGDTSITPQLTFGGNPIDFVTISTADGGASYNASYGTDEILAEGLIPDTKYTFELTVNHDMYLADYKIIAEDGTEYSANDVSIDNTIGSSKLDDLRFALTFGAGQGPISLGKPELFYGKEVKYVDEEAYSFDDSELSLSFASAPTLAEGETITDYIEVYDAEGNELYVYDAQVLNNEIKLTSNEICRGETYTIKVAPELTLGTDELGKELKLSVDVPLEQFDVADVDVTKTSNKADVTATLQNLETGTGTKDITMIVNITEVQNGNEVSKEVYLKTFSVPCGSASFDAVYNNIPCESGQKVKIFFADGTSSFGAISNRIFEY